MSAAPEHAPTMARLSLSDRLAPLYARYYLVPLIPRWFYCHS